MQDFDRLYREHAPHVRRFALHLCGEAAQADDITAETFVRVWATRASLRHATVRAFLFAIARNLFVTGVRASWRRVPLEDVHADPAPGPLARAESRAEADALATTVGQPGHWVVPTAPEGTSRLVQPGRPELSALLHRAASRRPSSQMPPLGTVVADREALALVSTWIAHDGGARAASCATRATSR